MGRLASIALLLASACSSASLEDPGEERGICAEVVEEGSARCGDQGEALEQCEGETPGACDELADAWTSCRDEVVAQALERCELDADACESLGRKASIALSSCLFEAGDCATDLGVCTGFE